jgi:hypothetical protein
MPERSFVGVALAIGTGVGAALGVALGNLALGIGVGIGVALLIGVLLDRHDARRRGGDGAAGEAEIGDGTHGVDDDGRGD